jgi:hypothetical protein
MHGERTERCYGRRVAGMPSAEALDCSRRMLSWHSAALLALQARARRAARSTHALQAHAAAALTQRALHVHAAGWWARTAARPSR